MTNREYELKRNSLIPKAMSEAKQKVAKLGRAYDIVEGVDGKDVQFWWTDYYFHRAMNRMAAEVGLTCANGFTRR